MGAKNILLFNPFGIGDVIFSIPVINALKQSGEKYNITYVCNRRVYPILSDHPCLDDVIIFEKDDFRHLLKRSKA
ncbi:MAG: lipopolysaccharide heptosyltransferase I, partial [Candidatus Omnitrophota bacterium]